MYTLTLSSEALKIPARIGLPGRSFRRWGVCNLGESRVLCRYPTLAAYRIHSKLCILTTTFSRPSVLRINTRGLLALRMHHITTLILLSYSSLAVRAQSIAPLSSTTRPSSAVSPSPITSAASTESSPNTVLNRENFYGPTVKDVPQTLEQDLYHLVRW